ncbi:MAG TPA: efflux RND transporter periplasmic adaptor subunit [Pirellulales bacterium]|jgi:RND family efflux transporter MFP subunit|nr:efflux RND transporter periplasmic adaptor subunit [Pirellulales bacterium]
MKSIHWTILLLSSVAIAGCQQAQSQTPSPAAPKPPEVFYTMPQMKEVTDIEDFTGHTEAVKMVQVRSRVSGYLIKVNFVDGADVKEGDVLFEIDSRPYVADLENKKSVVVQNERHTERLKADYDRGQKMLASKAISQEQFDQYHFDYIESQAALQAATHNRDSSQLNVDFTRVTAPISGKVSRRLVDPGNLVLADNTELTTIVSEDPIYGYFDVDEHTLLKVRHLIKERKIGKEDDSPVMLALSDENGFPHPGTINFIDNQLDEQTGTLRFRGTFPNHDHFISPGLFIRVRLPIGEPHQAVVLPESALGTDQGHKFVFVVNEKSEAIYTPVEVGPPYAGEMRVIEKGLTTSDRVVASGLQRVRSGMKVEAKELKPVESANGADTSSAKLPATTPKLLPTVAKPPEGK